MTLSRASSERGSASVEMVLMTPALVVMLLFIVALGRLTDTRGQVAAAARDAARSAANARTPATAELAGSYLGAATLNDRGVGCRRLTVTIDTTGFRADGIVAATVTCVVDLSDITGLGLPGTKTISSTFTAPVDPHRGIGA